MEKSKFKCLLKSLAVVTALSLSGNAMAANVWASAQKLSRVQATADGTFYLWLSDGASGVCREGGYMLTVQDIGTSVTVEGRKNMYALAMMAFAMKKKVIIEYDNSSAYCYVQQMTILDE